MKRIIEVLTAALSFLFNQRKQVEALTEQVTERDKIIADLRKALEDENADDASREEALNAANERAEELQAQLETILPDLENARIQAEALAAEITADPGIPLNVGVGGAPIRETVPGEVQPQASGTGDEKPADTGNVNQATATVGPTGEGSPGPTEEQ